MERDTFEEWVNDHVDEAIQRLDGGPRAPRLWIKALAASLGHLAEEAVLDEDDVLTEDEDDDFDVLGLDDEETA